MLRLRDAAEFEGLARDAWGIPSLGKEGLEDREEATAKGGDENGVDLVVVPSVAFDGTMGRLGHGKGYYDRWLERYKMGLGEGAGGRMPFLGMLSLLDWMCLRTCRTCLATDHESSGFCIG